jgi:hypothetical protein
MKHSIKYRSKKHKTRKYKTRKYKTRKYNTRKYNTRKYMSKRHLKGGELAVKPFEMLGYPHGASSDSQAALRTAQSKSQEQYEMNKIGGSEPEVEENKTMEVPQFYPIGGIKTAYTTSGLSADGNLASLVGEVDSTNDHFATTQTGGTRKKRKNYIKSRRNKRY